MKYQVTIKETLERVIEIEADSVRDAESEAFTRYWSGDVVLDCTDYTDVEFIAKEAE